MHIYEQKKLIEAKILRFEIAKKLCKHNRLTILLPILVQLFIFNSAPAFCRYGISAG